MVADSARKVKNKAISMLQIGKDSSNTKDAEKICHAFEK